MSELNVIIGLGQTGLSCVRYCLKKGWSFAVTDSREAPPGLDDLFKLAPDAEIVTGELSQALIQKATRLIVSPGVSLKETAIQVAIKQGVEFVGDIELFAREVKVPVIGITGSNGKSTVTALVGEMAKAAGLNTVVAGNIGTPILDRLDEAADLFVLELSSFQLETTHSLKLVAATVLNVSEDHMDRYDSLDDYAAAKQRIYSNAEVCVVNRDDAFSYYLEVCDPVALCHSGAREARTRNPACAKRLNKKAWFRKIFVSQKSGSRVDASHPPGRQEEVSFGMDSPVKPENDEKGAPENDEKGALANDSAHDNYGIIKKNNERYLAKGDECLISESELALQGDHHLLNAMAALALGDAVNLPMNKMLDTLKTFKGLPHRLEFICEKSGVKWYNDSKATNVGAVVSALSSLGNKKDIVLIAGGVGKGADFLPLKPAIEKHVKHLVLLGEAANDISTVCDGVVEKSFAKNLSEAVLMAATYATKDDKVLLSPACASFDMFKNFEDRGDQFKGLVNEQNT